eukprot:CAMPEP_0116871378 /NCGR_PEP_ID=MMETSP0463-20121206/1686_1 /TAXON_ID=181622 /ORGANISM="Strombidinopsis sp, Strain SopsisLIS2011" /LENGTH=145 /DNA_ID=CAMNT_0004509655 /DNA_START=1283 /DNA_END=1717 /DNA_ORIENTATION=+
MGGVLFSGIICDAMGQKGNYVILVTISLVSGFYELAVLITCYVKSEDFYTPKFPKLDTLLVLGVFENFSLLLQLLLIPLFIADKHRDKFTYELMMAGMCIAASYIFTLALPSVLTSGIHHTLHDHYDTERLIAVIMFFGSVIPIW